VRFPLAQATPEVREELASYCADGTCECAEDVQWLEFKGPVPGFRQVNALEHGAGQKMKCSVTNSNVSRQVLRFAVSGRYVSTAVHELEYCIGCNGSCHGHAVLATYDGPTGRSLIVRDVLKPDASNALKAHMIEYALKTYGSPEEAAFVRERLAVELSERQLPMQGFFVENDTVYVDLDSFVFSCASGSFFPVPVPRGLLAPAFSAK
jgi:hypothetical protein